MSDRIIKTGLPKRFKHDSDYIYITSAVTPEEGVKLLNSFFE